MKKVSKKKLAPKKKSVKKRVKKVSAVETVSAPVVREPKESSELDVLNESLGGEASDAVGVPVEMPPQESPVSEKESLLAKILKALGLK